MEYFLYSFTVGHEHRSATEHHKEHQEKQSLETEAEREGALAQPFQILDPPEVTLELFLNFSYKPKGSPLSSLSQLE